MCLSSCMLVVDLIINFIVWFCVLIVFASFLCFSLFISIVLIFFFFKQKTAYAMRISYWSSDVCSSDLFPDCLVLLVGSDTAGVANRLADEPNVTMEGEVPYDRLPFYLHAFDLALLPFRIIPLTLATNPVKAYEYLAAGKPVVSVDLPEIRQFGSLVYRAGGHEEFLERVGEALQIGRAQV